MRNTIFSRFFVGTIKGMRFFFIQMIVWMVVEAFFYLLGYRANWGRFGLLAFALQICVLVYTMLYSWFYSFVPVRYHLRMIFVPYLLYASLVYLGMVEDHDWNFKIVTVDKYMLMGWLVPLYGLGIWVLKKGMKKLLSDKWLKFVRIGLNIMIALLVLIIVLPYMFPRLFPLIK